MEDYSRYGHMGLHGMLNENSSALGRMQKQYWTTKQVVLRKLGKKEDACVIASDLELDLKLKIFETIEESFIMLMRLLENYQDRLCALAQEENSLGRFLKENGKQDKTKAGKAMICAGKALSYSAQQRLSLRIPLVRLYEEVETFHYRAILDTLKTVEKMEKARTAYRGSLMWMKDVSQQLDPDTCKQMEKFRKVQSQVKKAKQSFDKLKLDTLQKVDLLSFSRCNLFSQSLATYQNALVTTNKKISFTSNVEATTSGNSEQFEFSVLKELKGTTMKSNEDNMDLNSSPVKDKDTIIFLEAEYHDEVNSNTSRENVTESAKTENLKNHTEPSNNSPLTSSKRNQMINSTSLTEKETTPDLLNDLSTDSEHTTNGLFFLDEEIFSPGYSSTLISPDRNFNAEWHAMFGEDKPSTTITNSSALDESPVKTSNFMPSFLPSQLLNINLDLKATPISSEGSTSSFPANPVSQAAMSDSNSSSGSLRAPKETKRDMSAWFNLFADLDPLANPDMIGEKKDIYYDRNC